MSDSLIQCPSGTPNAPPVIIDMGYWSQLEYRIQEVATVTPTKAPELLATFNRVEAAGWDAHDVDAQDPRDTGTWAVAGTASSFFSLTGAGAGVVVRGAAAGARRPGLASRFAPMARISSTSSGSPLHWVSILIWA